MSSQLVEGILIRYRLQGPQSASPPLVFVHGAAGGQYVWLEQASDLAQDNRVLLYDLAGHGASESMPGPADVPSHARMLAGLLEALGLPPAVVVGHSMGGAIAMSLALLAPERVTGLVLVATGARLPVSPAVFEAIGAGLEAFGALLGMTAYSPSTPRELVARFTGAPIQAAEEVVRADFEACQTFDLRERLGEIAAPCLVLGGEKDALVGAGRLNQLAAGLPRARLQWIPEAGHMLMQEAPLAVNQAIRAFFSELREPARADG
ncbi:MAG: alpha/beta fold hydrolase [Polyangia bacterium]|jgi:pimeloyl-ACP methyl ester carboxylesterase|nr:alpha/beta fold hydrolase [Polyangia bacterium]